MGNSNGKPVVLTDEVDLNHFRLLRVVGKGAFGKVRIVERRDTGLTFALKYIRKDEVVRSESVRNIIRERRMLEHLDHPFLCNLRYSFQDVEYLYIVVDLMTGGDLRFHISRKTFTEPAVCFWMAELGCALRYIHRQGIVHRDVKPDNILLDAQGHLHLADFNVATELNPSRPLTGKSGTLAYLAPEVYAGRGYGAEVDWWSFGVTFYECIYNKRPFEGSSHEHLAQSIQRGDPPFPLTSPPVSPACQQAIQACLQRDGSKRLGAVGFDTFVAHPFFRHVNFDALERREIEPVFCPASDKTNFDATYDLEELLLEEAPLEARARKPKPRPELRDDATREEIRARELHHMIETMFEPFNYTLLPPDRAPAAPPAIPVPGSSAARRQNASSAVTPPPSSSPVAGAESQLPPSDRSRPVTSLRTQALQDAALSSNNSPEGSPPLLPAGLPREYFSSAPPPTSDPSSTTSTTTTKQPTPHTGSLRPQQQQQQPPPAAPGAGPRDDKPSGMLGFLSRNKIGRDRSPKPKARERGVLGKEGARVVVSHG